jgi:hypothetical protein
MKSEASPILSGLSVVFFIGSGVMGMFLRFPPIHEVLDAEARRNGEWVC